MCPKAFYHWSVDDRAPTSREDLLSSTLKSLASVVRTLEALAWCLVVERCRTLRQRGRPSLLSMHVEA